MVSLKCGFYFGGLSFFLRLLLLLAVILAQVPVGFFDRLKACESLSLSLSIFFPLYSLFFFFFLFRLFTWKVEKGKL